MKISTVLRLFLAASTLFFSVSCSRPPARMHLAADDLAEVLAIRWWVVELPDDIGPHDQVGVEIFSPDNKSLEGGGGFSEGPTGVPLGHSFRIYCWEDTARHQMAVMIKTENGSSSVIRLKDHFDGNANSGPANGAVMKVGDTLLKFGPSGGSFDGGNGLAAGQVGLRVEIARRP